MAGFIISVSEHELAEVTFAEHTQKKIGWNMKKKGEDTQRKYNI
jgi:hypothetical protein